MKNLTKQRKIYTNKQTNKQTHKQTNEFKKDGQTKHMFMYTYQNKVTPLNHEVLIKSKLQFEGFVRSVETIGVCLCFHFIKYRGEGCRRTNSHINTVEQTQG